MNLLLITRKIDKNDERTGFFIDWVLEFAKNLDKLYIICQELGDTSGLPNNVEIHSLGKEKGCGRLKQIFNFQFLIAKKIKEADGVFCHMIPHYAVLAGPFCKIYHKKLVQWYVHKKVPFMLRLANLLVDEYATTNPESFRLKTRRSVHYFGHGINMNKFRPLLPCHPDESQDLVDNGIPAFAGMTSKQKHKFTILSVSRISPSKNIDLIIKSIENIFEKKSELKNEIELQIIGAPGLREQQEYFISLVNYVTEHNLKDNIQILGPMNQEKILSYYQNCDLFINLSDTGSVDKAVLEAMACEKLVLTSNESFKKILPKKLFLNDKSAGLVADKILKSYYLGETEKTELQKKLRQEVMENHNLEKLTKKILYLFCHPDKNWDLNQ